MSIVTRPRSFIAWAFGSAFADRLDAIKTACPEARPTAEFGYAPRPYEDAFWTGFNLGLDREDAAPPVNSTPSQARAFQAGWSAGFREWERRLDVMFADRAADGRITDLDVYPRGVC